MPGFDLLIGKDFFTPKLVSTGQKVSVKREQEDQNATGYCRKEGATFGECRFVFGNDIRLDPLVAVSRVL